MKAELCAILEHPVLFYKVVQINWLFIVIALVTPTPSGDGSELLQQLVN